jgi:HPt (histidine-containing phosphotransfer) domain-containing protein
MSLYWQGALRDLDGDEALLRDLVAMFLVEYAKLMAAIDAAHASGEAAELRRAAHTLKGSADVIGANGVVTAAQRLADLGREGRPAPVQTPGARWRPSWIAFSHYSGERRWTPGAGQPFGFGIFDAQRH